ncbi:MAG: hypothetical protein HYR75_07115 [Gemmatimonadetes bacterium]|nr:hypothetical protein [Gemmatimonadota bacterium]MBI3569115.1 hypothetical protein [Gemmatimonadota bacterium]
MSVRARIALLALVAGIAVPAAAQSGSNATAEPQGAPAAAAPAPASAPVAVAQPSAGPRVDQARAGIREAAPAPLPAPAPRPVDTGHNRALMIVGAAALIVGAVMDNTAGHVIMAGGAVIGLYGLYKFLE